MHSAGVRSVVTRCTFVVVTVGLLALVQAGGDDTRNASGPRDRPVAVLIPSVADTAVLARTEGKRGGGLGEPEAPLQLGTGALHHPVGDIDPVPALFTSGDARSFLSPRGPPLSVAVRLEIP